MMIASHERLCGFASRCSLSFALTRTYSSLFNSRQCRGSLGVPLVIFFIIFARLPG